MEPKLLAQETVVVILAAGKGTRMGRSDLVKVCFEIDGVPAINRAIAVFKRQRFSRFLLVVGHDGRTGARHGRPGAPRRPVRLPGAATGHRPRRPRWRPRRCQTIGYRGQRAGDDGRQVHRRRGHRGPGRRLRQAAGRHGPADHPQDQGDRGARRPRLRRRGRARPSTSSKQTDLARQAIVDELRSECWPARTADRRARSSPSSTGTSPTRRSKPGRSAELLALAEPASRIDPAKLGESARLGQLQPARSPASATRPTRSSGLCTGVNPSLYLFTRRGVLPGRRA